MENLSPRNEPVSKTEIDSLHSFTAEGAHNKELGTTKE